MKDIKTVYEAKVTEKDGKSHVYHIADLAMADRWAVDLTEIREVKIEIVKKTTAVICTYKDGRRVYE